MRQAKIRLSAELPANYKLYMPAQAGCIACSFDAAGQNNLLMRSAASLPLIHAWLLHQPASVSSCPCLLVRAVGQAG